MSPPALQELAERCRGVVGKARADLGDDLGGFSILDLVADNFPAASLSDLKTALVVAGLTDLRKGRDNA